MFGLMTGAKQTGELDFTEVAGPDDVAMHPRLRRLFAYWRAITPPGLSEPPSLPGRAAFDPLDVHDLLPGIWMVDVQREPFRLRYRLCGTRLVEAYGFDPTGRWLDEVHPPEDRPDDFMRARAMVAQRRPTWRQGRPNLRRQIRWSSLENLYLPFAADGVAVDLIVAMTIFYDRQGKAV